MKKFLKYISQDYSNEKNIFSKIETWRENALNTLLIIVAAVFTPALIVWLLRFNSIDDIFTVGWLYFLIYFISVGIAIFRKVDYRLRAYVLIGLTFLTGVQSMRLGGLAGDGRIYLLILPILGLLLISEKAGALLSGLSIATYLILGFQISNNTSENIFIISNNPIDIATWLQEGIVFVACMAVVIVLQWKFNQVLESIALKNSVLNERNIKLVDDLENIVRERTSELQTANKELKKREIKLSEANAEAERANNAKSDFLSRMSHELRAPMNLMLGFAQLLELDKNEPLTSTQHKSIKHILDEGDYLLKMIDELLDISQIESGKMNIDSQIVDLNILLHNLLSSVMPIADKYQVDIELHPSTHNQYHVIADSHRLHQVLLNLIMNAIKYNRKKGKVNISFQTQKNSTIRIQVEDTGIGMPKEKLDIIFDPFVQLEIENINTDGVGLGLSLSKKIIHLMDGKIGVTSKIGQGSIFWIEIPMSAIDHKTTSSNNHSDDFQEISPPKCSILYIEDYQKNIDFLQQSVKEYPQINLFGALDGMSGLIKAKEHPDLILLDLNLPDINGYEVLQKLKSNDQTSKIPVVIISADATPRKIEFMINAGAIEYITKPINVKDFLTNIQLWISFNNQTD